MSKVINNFQGREKALLFRSPKGGVNSVSEDNPIYAKYIQNMVLNEDNNLSVRYGTRVVAEQLNTPDMIFHEQLKIMNYINNQGISELLIYQTYFIKIPYVNQEIISVNKIENNVSEILLDIRTLNNTQKEHLQNFFFDGVNIYIKQDSYSCHIEIYDFQKNNSYITFKVNLDKSFFDFYLNIPAFILWVERAGIFKFIDSSKNNVPEPLFLDLYPNVIVSSINYQNCLVICNGFDPVLYYNGNIIEELKADYQIDSNSVSKLSSNSLEIKVNLEYQNELKENLKVDSNIRTANDLGLKQYNTITNISFVIVRDKLIITITTKYSFLHEPKKVFYNKKLPHFSYINVINDRLFALDSGGSFYKKYRSPDKAMLVYFCSKRKSLFDWYSTKGIIGQINLAANSNKYDDLQCFNTYQGRILFWGKESVQIWIGNDPTVVNDGQNIDFGDFRWLKTEPVGMFNKNMFVELPDYFIFLSKFGICSISIDGFNNLKFNPHFAKSVNSYVQRQLENLQSEREYRSLSSFVYPYGNFIGFKFIHNCYIYQLKAQENIGSFGSWTIFSQSFNISKSFFYDSVSKNLYLSYENKTLVYADKIYNKTYMDIESSPIPFNITYNWFNITSTWFNENFYIGCSSNEKIKIKLKLYINYDMSNYETTELTINQINTKYNFSRFDIDKFSDNEKAIYPQETLRFKADSLLLNITGIAYNEFTFDSLYLAGGTND